MKSLILFIIISMNLMATDVKNPIVDFYHLNIADRYCDDSVTPHVEKISIDIDCDNLSDLFIGGHKHWWGDTKGRYYAIYRNLGNGYYRRLTGPNEDIRLSICARWIANEGNYYYEADKRAVYVGKVDEFGKIGLLMAQLEYSRELEDVDIKTVCSIEFYHIENDALKVIKKDDFDMKKKEDRDFYFMYFGKNSQQGGCKITILREEDLKKWGFVSQIGHIHRLQKKPLKRLKNPVQWKIASSFQPRALAKTSKPRLV